MNEVQQKALDAAISGITGDMTALWLVISAILVFFMQAGFTLVEVGFTRGKNAGNIILKNLMDLSIGSIMFWAVGYAFMYGDTAIAGGFMRISSAKEGYFFFSADDWHNLFFQTVFCATAATIVSGAVAGRTKFSTYLIFSAILTTIIYPIAGGWQWFGEGAWLYDMGFIDFAGSSIVHAVGGAAALVGAKLVGPRIGKYVDGKVNVIPGHNLVYGALGVLILWLGWFGFNGGSQLAWGGSDTVAAGSVIINTNIAAAIGAIAALFFTWLRYGKADISMTLNGALAGLVGITAGCGNVNAFGALWIGLICGIVVVLSIELIDKKLRIDDPVGAISVHGVCGFLGTVLVGVFALDGGLFYGGGVSLLGVQTLGSLSYIGWSLATSFIVLFILKKTIGLRVSEKEEIEGLDVHEHGMSVYNEQ